MVDSHPFGNRSKLSYPRHDVAQGHLLMTYLVMPSNLGVTMGPTRVGADETVPHRNHLRQHPLNDPWWDQ